MPRWWQHPGRSSKIPWEHFIKGTYLHYRKKTAQLTATKRPVNSVNKVQLQLSTPLMENEDALGYFPRFWNQSIECLRYVVVIITMPLMCNSLTELQWQPGHVYGLMDIQQMEQSTPRAGREAYWLESKTAQSYQKLCQTFAPIPKENLSSPMSHFGSAPATSELTWEKGTGKGKGRSIEYWKRWYSPPPFPLHPVPPSALSRCFPLSFPHSSSLPNHLVSEEGSLSKNPHMLPPVIALHSTLSSASILLLPSVKHTFWWWNERIGYIMMQPLLHVMDLRKTRQ